MKLYCLPPRHWVRSTMRNQPINFVPIMKMESKDIHIDKCLKYRSISYSGHHTHEDFFRFDVNLNLSIAYNTLKLRTIIIEFFSFERIAYRFKTSYRIIYLMQMISSDRFKCVVCSVITNDILPSRTMLIESIINGLSPSYLQIWKWT